MPNAPIYFWRTSAGLMVFLLMVGFLAQDSIAVAAEAPVSPQQATLSSTDRLVWIGPTWVEQDVRTGAMEAELQSRLGGETFVLRNLGWSGDTVWAESRGIFDPPAAGYSRMLELAKELKPTTIWLSYGANESWAGPAGLEKFVSQYKKLAHDFTSSTGAKIVFVTPFAFVHSRGQYRDPSSQNGNMALYVEAIRKLAAEQQAPVIDLFAEVKGEPPLESMNGIHLEPEGERRLARRLADQIQFVNAEGQAVKGLKLTQAEQEELRKAIVAKNTLFFHRWRPQNITYLTGFRKHEQGNNAVEIAQFDPLVDEAEKAIAAWLKSHQAKAITPATN
ncbi:hypothetical protein Plim_0665 [Planctopirus limnophila DSM 3776]|uniref:SGNH hydrolase-type esterase domain-containing protein n=1 Tax=Planctopirus limnophila (strain ATCC 43296 / DSM 3776 / IFAM 1008 / Mu 290) TaxID=521674 RepID=D5SR44_PLAL2|nr:GDSL-type esterase/lipase family protein [Planctopirus limnophila]ADG66512.1 hypothetical protein Plim_0665 [Planctopirus limnophila DSM 3776]